MGFFGNIKSSIDDRSSMSVNSAALLISSMTGVVIGLVVCFVLIYDVVSNGYVRTDMDGLAWLLMSSGGYIATSGLPKAYVDGKIKMRSWVEGEKMEIDAAEEVRRHRESVSQSVPDED